MTNLELAGSFRRTAGQILEEAESFFNKGVWHLVVRRCQEAVEFCLKGWLRAAGVDVPKVHDVGKLFRHEAQRFPGFPIDLIVLTSKQLRADRELSIYGDDKTLTPPEHLYSEKQARAALEAARKILSWQAQTGK